MTTSFLSRRPFRSLGSVLHTYGVRLAVLSAFAAALAYGIGSLSPHISAVVAAITAIIAVRPTFHGSLREGLTQVLGVLCGAALAFVALTVMGFSALALFVTVLACFGVARLLRIGDEGAAAVAVTVVLVAGPQWNADAVETRLLGVLLGSAVALTVSFFTRPGTPHGRALNDAIAAGERTSALLIEIGTALSQHRGQIPIDLARAWLDDAEDVVAQLAEIRREAEDALTGARWSPLLRRGEAQAVLDQVQITESAALTVLGTCRDLVASAESDQSIPSALADSLGHVLLSTASAITTQGDGARVTPATLLPDNTGPVPVVHRTRRQAVEHVRDVDDTAPLLLGGSLLRDSESITDLLTER